MLITPYWFGQRQLKAEAVGENYYRITGPNSPPRFLGLRKADNGKLLAFLRTEQDGADDYATAAEFDSAYNAWEAAFELYRARVII